MYSFVSSSPCAIAFLFHHTTGTVYRTYSCPYHCRLCILPLAPRRFLALAHRWSFSTVSLCSCTMGMVSQTCLSPFRCRWSISPPARRRFLAGVYYWVFSTVFLCHHTMGTVSQTYFYPCRRMSCILLPVRIPKTAEQRHSNCTKYRVQ